MPSKTQNRDKTWEQKFKTLRLQHRELKAEIAKISHERDVYLRSLHALSGKPFSFSEEELRAMEKNPASLEDLLQEFEGQVGE
jgi:hypothetical protein